ncbi:unnamed protein product [Danaus chrysippus]|uniref:(African queen) hypothetical protein n=1 Tax=Danaus chrysippus TaxID=151541 RepID=A0A8J2R9G0_9NEOP|nr:unnamed protein product [Danaus chrysippus]
MMFSILTREHEASAAAPSPPVDAHANLMAAIRQAGGVGRAKLRHADDMTTDKASKPVSGDLMADLHAKLSMRRRGISGAEGTVLHTLARIIPEPGETTERSSSDDEWD